MPQSRRQGAKKTGRDRKDTPVQVASRIFWRAVLIIVATLLSYTPALRGGFIWDDDSYLTNSVWIRSPHGLYDFWFTNKPIDYYPISNTSLWLEWRLWGLNASGYHITNFVLHLISVFLLWLILARLSIPGAFLAVLLFAVHPVNVESVAWIAQRKEMLALVFFFTSILFYLKSESPRRWLWYSMSLLAFLLGMLSKASVVGLPLVLLLLAWWRNRRIGKQDLIRAAPFFLIAGGITLFMMWFWRDVSPVLKRDAGFVERLLGAGGVVWFYLYKALWPANLMFVYPSWRIDSRSALWWIPLLAVIATSVVLWWFRNSRARLLVLAWFFFLIGLLPIMGFFDVYFMQYSLVADHYQHMAIIAPIALFAAGWTRWRATNRTSANTVASLTVVVLMYLTFQQGRIYQDAETLYWETLAKNPDCWMAHNNLGAIMFDTGRADEAATHFREAMRLNPRDSEPHSNLGNVLMQQGRLREAIAEYEKALELNPKHSATCNNLAWLYATAPDPALRDGDKAVQLAERAVAIVGNTDSRIQDTLAAAYAQAGRYEEAIASASRAIELATAEGQVGLVNEVQSRLPTYRSSRAASQAATKPADGTKQ